MAVQVQMAMVNRQDVMRDHVPRFESSGTQPTNSVSVDLLVSVPFMGNFSELDIEG
jgi:hypothetical protein